MTTLLMTAMVLLSLYWSFAVSLYAPASAAGAAIALLLGLLSLWLAVRCAPPDIPRPSRSTAAFLLAVLAIAAVGLPGPCKVGPVLAIVGLVGWAADGHRRDRPRALWHAFAVGGFVLIAQSVVVPLYMTVAAAEHDLPQLRWPLYGLLRFLGHDASVGPNGAFVSVMRELHGFPVT